MALAVAASGSGLRSLAPSGPHAVGRQLVWWKDPLRPTGELAVWIWYPADPSGRGEPQRALPESWASERASAAATRFGEEAARRLAALRVHSIDGAKLAPGAGKFPVLVFSPGMNWLPVEYSSILEDLASHGYIVAGIAPKTSRGPADTASGEDDLRFARSQLRGLNADSASPFRGRLDLDRAGVFGHSLGGAAALAVAAVEPGYKAALNIDGDAMNSQPRARPSQPLLLLNNEEPLEAESDLELQGRIRSEKRRTNDWSGISERSCRAVRLRLMGSRHLDFTDMTLVPREALTPAQRRFRFGPIDGARALVVTREIVRAFFDHTLRGKLAPDFGKYAEIAVIASADTGECALTR